MELTLTHQSATQVTAHCNGDYSHTFDLLTLAPDPAIAGRPPQPLADPVAYGQALYQALFPPPSPAQQALASGPERLLLVTDEQTDVVPWEYLYGPDGFLVLDVTLVRGLPADQRRAPPDLDRGLHIVAVPSNPLDPGVLPLNIDGEWQRLKEVMQEVSAALTLERTRPPTLEQLRRQVAGQQQRVVHFMGHGGTGDNGTVLCFEQLDGGLATVTAKDFIRRTKGTIFLVTLNACVSATPGDTDFANLAAALVQQGTPYALGMRFSVLDSDARTLSRVLYSELARGSSVEEAVQQARLELADSPQRWAIGVPVLYTALSAPAAGFAPVEGQPRISEHQPPLELLELPRAEGTFHGRQDTLREIGSLLTSDSRPRLLTIHGSGGQGKTALAREAVERFAHAFPGGVVAVSLENLPAREQVVTTLARFLGIDTETISDPAELERQVLTRLGQQRTLLVLDNAETLIQQVNAEDEQSLHLAEFLRYVLPNTQITLLATSRVTLDWPGEQVLHLDGLPPHDGWRLFCDNAPQRSDACQTPQVWQLSTQLYGHPLSLKLLGSAFNFSVLGLEEFIAQYEQEVLHATDKYRHLDHRHRSVYASIETSVRFMDDDLRALLGGLWVFQAPFPPLLAEVIFDPDTEYPEGEHSPIYDQLDQLLLRSALEIETIATIEETRQFYRLHPTMRIFAANYLTPPMSTNELHERFGEAYTQFVSVVFDNMTNNALAVATARLCAGDLDRGLQYVTGKHYGWYALKWGQLVYRLGDPHRGLKLCLQSLAASEDDQLLKIQALNILGLIYQTVGQPNDAIAAFRQALTIGVVHDRTEQEFLGTTLNNIAAFYMDTGEPQEALALLEQARSTYQKQENGLGEALVLNNMSQVYMHIGQAQQAIEYLNQALPVFREERERVWESMVLSNLGHIYRSIGQSERALQLLQKSLHIKREMGDLNSQAVSLNNIAAVYQSVGQLHHSLQYLDQALPIFQEVGNRRFEAVVLINMGEVYRTLGKPRDSLDVLNKALPIVQEVEDRTNEAVVLLNIGEVHRSTGNPQRALTYFDQAMTIQRSVEHKIGVMTTLNLVGLAHQSLGQFDQAMTAFTEARALAQAMDDRKGEAGALHNMALVYQSSGQSEQALQLFEQALPVLQEVGDRTGEVSVLNALGMLYRREGQVDRAIMLYEQAFDIVQHVGDRAKEAATLNNLATLYQVTGDSQRALGLFEQALPLTQEVGDRSLEAFVLEGLGNVSAAQGELDRAVDLHKQAQAVMQEVGNPAGEAATLTNLADLLYEKLRRSEEAQQALQEAIVILERTGLDRDAGGVTLVHMKHFLAQMQRGVALGGEQTEPSVLPAEQVELFVGNTIVVLTSAPEQYNEWCSTVANALQHAQSQGADWQPEVEFFTTLLQWLDGQTTMLPQGHPYAEAISTLHMGIEISESQLPLDSFDLADDMLEAVLAFIEAENWEIAQRLVEEQQTLLFAPEVETFLKQYITFAQQQGNEPQIEVLTVHLDILRGCKTAGIAATFAQLLSQLEPTVKMQQGDIPDAMFGAALAFVGAENWDACRQVLENHQASLFQPEVESLFEQNISHANNQDDLQLAEVLQVHLNILRACKQQGIAATLAQLEAQNTEQMERRDTLWQKVRKLFGRKG